MTSQEYLQELLKGQNLSLEEEYSLRNLRDQIQNRLATLSGNPRFYYAGSYSKKTLIREQYDLDIVVYWPFDCGYTLQGIYDAVGEELKKEWTYVYPKIVSWQIPFIGGFHIDVVPGRALDRTFKDANLYRRDKDSSLKTSI
jgi:tRNA nucleotidyltransferase (CCA-adding enzyme)